MTEPYSYLPSNLTDAPEQVGGVICKARDAAPDNRDTTEGRIQTKVVNEDGAQYALPYGPQIWSYSNQSSSTQTDTAVHAAPGANLSIYLTDIYVAANGPVTITLEDGDNTFLWRYYAQAAGDGAKDSRFVPIKLTANKSLTYTTSGAVEHTVVLSGTIAP